MEIAIKKTVGVMCCEVLVCSTASGKWGSAWRGKLVTAKMARDEKNDNCKFTVCLTVVTLWHNTSFRHSAALTGCHYIAINEVDYRENHVGCLEV